MVSQRLVRRVCPRCVTPYVPDPDALKVLGLSGAAQYKHGAGCDACCGRGYKGRIAIFELLHISDCSQCEGAIEPDFEACPHCGVDLRTACPGCGHDTQSDWRTCPYCRTDLSTVNETGRRQRLPAAHEADDDDLRPPAIRALGPGTPS